MRLTARSPRTQECFHWSLGWKEKDSPHQNGFCPRAEPGILCPARPKSWLPDRGERAPSKGKARGFGFYLTGTQRGK